MSPSFPSRAATWRTDEAGGPGSRSTPSAKRRARRKTSWCLRRWNEEAKKKLITQREAAEELGLSTRQVKRLLYALKKRGDKAVIHGVRGKPSKRRIEEAIES